MDSGIYGYTGIVKPELWEYSMKLTLGIILILPLSHGFSLPLCLLFMRRAHCNSFSNSFAEIVLSLIVKTMGSRYRLCIYLSVFQINCYMV
jgi:hypothetical protein